MNYRHMAKQKFIPKMTEANHSNLFPGLLRVIASTMIVRGFSLTARLYKAVFSEDMLYFSQ